MTEQPTEQPTLGFIGLGIMGRPMAQNLRKAGFPLIVYDLLPQATATLVAAGARTADSPRAVAAQTDIVLLCLPDSPDVQAAMQGNDGVFAGVKAGQIIIDMSTISPVTARAPWPPKRRVWVPLCSMRPFLVARSAPSKARWRLWWGAMPPLLPR